MALLQQDGNSEKQEKEAALYLQQGLEYVMARALTAPEHGRYECVCAGTSVCVCTCVCVCVCVVVCT